MGAAAEGLDAVAVARRGWGGAETRDLGSGMGMGTRREIRGWEAVRRRGAGTAQAQAGRAVSGHLEGE